MSTLDPRVITRSGLSSFVAAPELWPTSCNTGKRPESNQIRYQLHTPPPSCLAMIREDLSRMESKMLSALHTSLPSIVACVVIGSMKISNSLAQLRRSLETPLRCPSMLAFCRRIIRLMVAASRRLHPQRMTKQEGKVRRRRSLSQVAAGPLANIGATPVSPALARQREDNGLRLMAEQVCI